MVGGRATAAFVLLGLLSATASAQELEIPPAKYPDLPAVGSRVEDFVPAGWKLEQSLAGDLNKDGVDDIAIVLREENPANVLKNERLGENPFNTNPRILAAAFGSGGVYKLALQDHSLIPRRESPTLDDPMDEGGGISIDRGSLVVNLRFFASAGAWETFSSAFRLRHDGETFRLIGYDKNWVHRASGEEQTTSINYITGVAEIEKGTIEKDEPDLRSKRHIGRKALLSIEQIGNGLEFEPFGSR